MGGAQIRANEVQKTLEPVHQPGWELIRQQEQGPVPAVAPQVAYGRVQLNPNRLRPADLLALQRAVGNRGVQRMVAKANDEQQDETAEEDSERTVQTKLTVGAAKDVHGQEADRAAGQVMTLPDTATQHPNRTGLPDGLKFGVESLSGISLDSVNVHYNSSQPAQLAALAYTQGSDIHVAPGQEQHLPHEAWHVVQQAQRRVKPTMQMKDEIPVNDEGLEREADVISPKSVQMRRSERRSFELPIHRDGESRWQTVVQRKPFVGTNTEQGLLWHDEADPEKRQFIDPTEMLAANAEYNREEDYVKTKVAYEEYKARARKRQEKFLMIVGDIVKEMPTVADIRAEIEPLKSKAGNNAAKRAKYLEVKQSLDELLQKVARWHVDIQERLQEGDTEHFYLTESRMKAARKYIKDKKKRARKCVAQLHDLVDKLLELLPPVPEVEKTKEDVVAAKGEYGVITRKALNSIPPPFDERIRDYLSTMARAKGQPGIHTYTDNKTVVLKFLGILGDKGIKASGTDSQGRYIFKDKLSSRH